MRMEHQAAVVLLPSGAKGKSPGQALLGRAILELQYSMGPESGSR